ncbi:MAG: hypothetical protein WBB19_19790 [Desulforhopalus sp.]
MLKLLIAWFIMLLVSILNGAIRDFTYGKHVNELRAHQLSSVSSVFLLGMVILGYMRFHPPATGQEAMTTGLVWMVLTLAFEFLFFHFVGGHSWAKLFANYNVLKGRVWIFVLLWLAVAPYIIFCLNT